MSPDDIARLKDGRYIVKGGRGGPMGMTPAQRRRVAKGQPRGPLTAAQKRKIISLRKQAGSQAMRLTRRQREEIYGPAKKTAKKAPPRTRGGTKRRRAA